ncbi:MAG: SPFH domain-containing protein [Phycisphaerae bacterium]
MSEDFRKVRIYPDGPGDGGGGARRGRGIAMPRLNWLLLVVLAGLVYGGWWWFVERVEVGPNALLVLVNKTGRELPDSAGDQVVLYPELVKALAAKDGRSNDWVREHTKGIRYEVLREGRYFFSPIDFERIVIRATIIPENKFGVLIRRYGRPLPAGHTVAVAPDERGPVSGTLPPGRHDVNTLAYDVQLFDRVAVPEGWVGVQTLLSSGDPNNANEYVMQPGERGVQAEMLGPGTYFDRNPYEYRVDLVDARSQKYDILGDDAIEFPSNDGFTIHMEATIEWALYPDRVPFVVVEVGDLDDVVSKVIRPYATSLARIQGSKMTAREFMGAREAFQRHLFTDLRERCRVQGVLIKAATVRDLKPPERVRAIIRERELADQTIMKYENEIAEAAARANLVEQEELANQQQSMGDANKEVVALVTQADQTMQVAVTNANQRLDVAKLDLDSARRQAEAVLARGRADAQVVLMGYQAKAEPLRALVSAVGDGETLARNLFLQKVGPAIRSVLADANGPIGDILRDFARTSGAAAAPARTSPARESAGSNRTKKEGR